MPLDCFLKEFKSSQASGLRDSGPMPIPTELPLARKTSETTVTKYVL